MSEQNLKEGSFKQKIIHELKTVGWLSLYLALFFCALCTYSMLMLHELNVTNSFFRYGFAIINALVLAKIIMIGEYARLGRRHEDQPLIISTLWKAFLFGLLVPFTFSKNRLNDWRSTSGSVCARMRCSSGIWWSFPFSFPSSLSGNSGECWARAGCSNSFSEEDNIRIRTCPSEPKMPERASYAESQVCHSGCTHVSLAGPRLSS